MLDCEAVELGHVLDLGAPRGALVGRGDAQDLVVAALLVAHAEHSQRAAADHAARERRFLQEHQGIQRVAILAERVINETVVVRVAG